MKRERPKPREHAHKRIWKPSVLARYWLLQMPGTVALVLVLLVLERLFAVPLWLLGAILAAWVVKDALLYPLLWRAYDPDFPSAHSLIGERGVALERIDPVGYVRIRGERWRAELAAGAGPVDKNEPVRVEAIRSLTLVVSRLDDE